MKEIEWRPGTGRVAFYDDAELELARELGASEAPQQVDLLHDLKFELDAFLIDEPLEEPAGEQLSLRDEAHARTTDPWTSHAAAASLSREDLRETQAAVLEAFRIQGPMHHEALIDLYEPKRWDMRWPQQSVSGLRTRTKELVDGGLLGDTGRVVILGSGRASKIWEVR
jgi:hypothetical protein